MADSASITLIVGVFNGERHLAELLDSVLAQTRGDWRCICVDDGSRDGSAEILARYARRDSRFRIVAQPNSGVGAARNAALELADTPYVMFADQDDTLAAQAFETAVAAIEKHGADIVRFRSDCSRKLDCFVWERIFRTSVFAEVRFPPITGGEDTALFWELRYHRFRTAAIGDMLYFNRNNPGSCSRKASPRYVRNVFSGFRHMWLCSRRHGEHPAKTAAGLFPHVFWFCASIAGRHCTLRNLAAMASCFAALLRGRDPLADENGARALDEALAGTGLAKDSAAKALSCVMIPEALDYPM